MPPTAPIATRSSVRRPAVGIVLCAAAAAVLVVACDSGGGPPAATGSLPVTATAQDFVVPGSHQSDVNEASFFGEQTCSFCHGGYAPQDEPSATWRGSLMAYAGRDPLYFAQLATAKQDVSNVDTYCLRCHVPTTTITGTNGDPSAPDAHPLDQEGVTCHFCHAMVDPVYKPGISPVEDVPILAELAAVPAHYGNAQYVLDPFGVRRGPRADHQAAHGMIVSPFHSTGAFCGTCHDVGNVAVSRQPDGTYRYNALDAEAPDADPQAQFPLERTYSEWKLSAFATGGVDMQGRFGGTAGPVVSTCQDCHMPAASAKACFFGPTRPDMRRHDFAGAGEWVLSLVAMAYATEPGFPIAEVVAGRDRSLAFLAQAGTLELTKEGASLRVRAYNETGHKLPTGHIEGRRAWVNVRFRDAQGALLAEHGAYDPSTALLDEVSTRVYEMRVGLSAGASAATGLPQGATGHMALADTIVKDTRIPPRGFANAAYEAAGAPVVGHAYADGQYWDDQLFPIPAGAVTAEAVFNYQVVTREYVEHLQDGNVTDHWGDTLYGLWLASGKATPRPMASATLALSP